MKMSSVMCALDASTFDTVHSKVAFDQQWDRMTMVEGSYENSVAKWQKTRGSERPLKPQPKSKSQAGGPNQLGTLCCLQTTTGRGGGGQAQVPGVVACSELEWDRKNLRRPRFEVEATRASPLADLPGCRRPRRQAAQLSKHGNWISELIKISTEFLHHDYDSTPDLGFATSSDLLNFSHFQLA